MIVTAMQELMAKPPAVREVLKRYMLNHCTEHDAELEACARAALTWWADFWADIGSEKADTEEEFARQGLEYQRAKKGRVT